MRSFLQKKAGATYFGGSNFTANIRKHNVEFICALDGGWHAVMSVVPTHDGVIMLACLGDISAQIERIIPSLRLKPGEHTQFTDILEGGGEYHLLNINADGKGEESGIGKEIKDAVNQPLDIIGDKELQKEAGRLCNVMLRLYKDLSKSPYPSLKALTDCFYDR